MRRVLNRIGEGEQLALAIVDQLRAEQLRDRHRREARDTTPEKSDPFDAAAGRTLATARLVVPGGHEHG